MIKNDRHRAARVKEWSLLMRNIRTFRRLLRKMGGADLTEVQKFFYVQNFGAAGLRAEIREYDNAKAGEIKGCYFDELGTMLIKWRIARNLTQRQLAERVGAHEAQLSRWERDEYKGVGMPRIIQVIEAMNLSVTCSIKDKHRIYKGNDPSCQE